MPDRGNPVIVTGAAGFIGSHVSEALAARGHDVVGIDCLDGFYSPAVKRRTLDEVIESGERSAGSFTFVELDVRRGPEVRQLFDRVRPSGVVHLAARAGVRPSIEQPALYFDVNLTGTAHLLEASRLVGTVGRFVCASSSSVYGNNLKVPFSEEDAVAEPISPYAATKRACELLGHTHHHLHGTPVAMLRFFTVFGPRQRPDLAIAKFIEIVRRGGAIPMFGDGSTSRDYTYIGDIVAGVLAAYDRVPDHGYRVWNLGGNDPVTLREMIATIGRVLAVEPVVERQPMQPGDVERTFADLARARAELGYEPTTSFEEGVRMQAEWAAAWRAGAGA